MSNIFIFSLKDMLLIFITLFFIIYGIKLFFENKIKCKNEFKRIYDNQDKEFSDEMIKYKILNYYRSGREFEVFLYNLFMLNRYKCELTSATCDKGRDIILYDPEDGKKIFVEAKRYSYKNRVGREVIQKLLGACSMYGAKEGYVITTSSFTKTALDCLKDAKNLKLWCLDDLARNVNYLSVEDKIKLFSKSPIRQVCSNYDVNIKSY